MSKISTKVEAYDLISQLGKELVVDYEAENVTVDAIVTALLNFQVLTPAIIKGTISGEYSGLTRSIKVDGDTILRGLFRLRDTVGGYIYVDNDRKLQWVSSIGEDKGQQIRYRKNLKGIERNINYDSLVNKLYCYGAGEGSVRIKLSDASGQTEDYVEDTDSQTEWGGIYIGVMVDKSITHPDTLLAWANLKLADVKDPVITYRVDTVDLSKSTEIDFDFEALQLGSTIKVIDEELGIDIETTVVRIEHPDLLHPEQMNLELATRTKDITDTLLEVYDKQQFDQHIATTIGAGQVIVKGVFTVLDWATEGETTIKGDCITTGTVELDRLSFIPLTSAGTPGEVIATINATTEGIKIKADKIEAVAGINVFKQDNIPTSEAIGDLWFDTDDENKLYRAACAGADEIKAGEWELVRDKDIAQALTDAANAKAAADAAQSDATDALADLSDIADDAKITPVEKLSAKKLWDEIVNEKPGIDTQANTFGVSKTDYDNAYNALNTYLNTTLGVFDNMDITTSITRATWNTNWNTYYTEKIDLLNAVAVAAKAIADSAQIDATQALDDAATALQVADGEIVGFYQNTEPTTGMSFGDIWIDTDGHTPPNENDIYRYEDASGGSQGALAWRAASTNAVGLVYLDAYGAQSTADGKIVTFYQDDVPTATDAGDLWIDTNDKNKLYRATAKGDDEIIAGEWESVRDTDIAQALADAATALAVADGEIVGYYQDSEPSAGMHFGDIWIDTDGHDPLEAADIYRYEDAAGGSQGVLAWRAAPTNAVGLVYLDMASAQATADGKIMTFYQAGIPTSTDAGDLWIDTDDDNKLYRAACIGADEIKTGEWELVRDMQIDANSTNITTNANGISANVTNITTIDGKVTTNEGNISTNATSITFKVSTTDYNGSTICSKINLTSSAITIDAKHININGDCHFTDNYDPSEKIGDIIELLASDAASGQKNVVLTDADAANRYKIGNVVELKDDSNSETCEVESLFGSEEQLENNNSMMIYSVYPRAGQKLKISSLTVTKLSFLLSKSGSPSGNVVFAIRKVSDDSVIQSEVWGDAASLPTDDTWEEVTFSSPVQINEEVRICAKFSGGDSSNFVFMSFQSTDVKANEVRTWYDGTSWYDDTTKDVTYKYTCSEKGLAMKENLVNSYTVAANAKVTLFGAADNINNGTTTIDGGKITTQTISADRIISVTYAQITNVEVENADIVNVSAGKITAGTITGETIIISGSAGILKSNTYVAGSAGWQIKGNGDAEFNEVTVRGAIHAKVGSSIDYDYVDNGPPVDAEANPDYIHSTYISATEIRSPVIRAGEIKADYTLEVKGAISAASGTVVIDSDGVTIKGQKLTLTDSAGGHSASFYIDSNGYPRMDASGWGKLYVRGINSEYRSTMYDIEPINSNSYLGLSSNPWPRVYANYIYPKEALLIPDKADAVAMEGSLATDGQNLYHYANGAWRLHKPD